MHFDFHNKQASSNLMPNLIEFLLSKRYWLTLAMVLVGSIVAWGVNFTTLESRFDSILSEDDPYKAEVDQARKDFPPSTSVLFAFESDDGVFSLPAMQADGSPHSRYSEVDFAVSVGSLMNRRLNSVDAERYNRDYLIPDLALVRASDLPGLKALALGDEDLTKSLLSPEGDMALAVVKYKVNVDDQATRLSVCPLCDRVA